MAKYFIIVILAVLIVVLGVQIFFIYKDGRNLKASLTEMSERVEALSKENDKLQAQIDYYSRPENLEKELRAQFNYKKPDEKMMIIVP